MKAQTPQEAVNEQTIRKLYSLANATTKDTPGFVAMFGNGGYFDDVGAGRSSRVEWEDGSARPSDLGARRKSKRRIARPEGSDDLH